MGIVPDLVWRSLDAFDIVSCSLDRFGPDTGIRLYDAYTGPNACADCCGRAADANALSDIHGLSHSDAVSDLDGPADSHAHPHCDSYSDRNAQSHANGHFDAAAGHASTNYIGRLGSIVAHAGGVSYCSCVRNVWQFVRWT